MPTLSRPAARVGRTLVYDSRRWDGYEPRPDDIVIATYPKCGTTWTQRIVGMLVFQSTDPRDLTEISPWLDSRIFTPVEADLALLAAQTHRRFIKSHLPFDCLPVYEEVKYIHVARDGRDACMSFHNHLTGFTSAMLERMAGLVAEDGGGGRVVPDDPRAYFLQWISEAENGGTADTSFFDFENSYWRERQRPNLLLVHYNDLKADLAGEIARISEFLDIDTPPALLADFARAAEFSKMKSQGAQIMAKLAMAFEGGAQRFLHKGANGRWRDILTAADLARFDDVVRGKFSPACAAWVQGGRLAAGDPRMLR